MLLGHKTNSVRTGGALRRTRDRQHAQGELSGETAAVESRGSAGGIYRGSPRSYGDLKVVCVSGIYRPPLVASIAYILESRKIGNMKKKGRQGFKKKKKKKKGRNEKRGREGNRNPATKIGPRK